MSKLVIAIDGPVGSGKSTVARRVARLLNYVYVDTGAMYRAVALKALRQGILLDSSKKMATLASAAKISVRMRGGNGGGQEILLDGEDVSEAIRAAEVAQAASRIAALPGVREVLVPVQRQAGANGGVVMEGRDIGSVVFPNAGLKIFLTASVEVRARRRWREYLRASEGIDFEEMIKIVEERDRRDSERRISPLIRAADAVVIDSSAMESEEVARTIAMLAGTKCGDTTLPRRAKRDSSLRSE
jgi:cytidylate kinase